MSKLSDYKALLFDIDGTLATKDKVIPDEVIANLNKLAKQGYKIGVCTGRGFATIVNKVIPMFPANSIHILAGGSELINSNGKVIWESPIDPELIGEIREYVDNTDYVISYAKADAQYATEKLMKFIKSHPWEINAKEISEMSNEGVGLIFLANLDKKIESFIKNHPKLSHKHMIGNSGNAYLDITAKGVNKAVALKQYAKQLGISTKEIIGFGDSLNDIEFLEACGFAVAMGNAKHEVKEIADITIGHVNENGLATYLSKIINGENL